MRQVALIILLLSVTVVSAQAELNLSGTPTNSPSPVLSQEIWGKLNTDYFSNEIEVARLTVDAEAYFENMVAELDNCVGSLPSEPTYMFHWDRASVDEVLPVRIFAASTGDPTLVIREPDGDWYCADNFETVLYPLISIPSLRSGAYQIWVGSKTNSDLFTGRLFISIGDHTPVALPPACCEGLVFSNPAQSATEATITYVEVNKLDNGILVSSDVTFRGESGSQFVVELVAYNLASNQEIQLDTSANRGEWCEASPRPCESESLRRSTQRRDYSVSAGRRGPIEFLVDSLEYEALGVEYTLDLVISNLDEDGAILGIADSLPIEAYDD